MRAFKAGQLDVLVATTVISADVSSMSTQARIIWANLRSHKAAGGKLDDGEVYAGMHTVLDLLKKVPASRISESS